MMARYKDIELLDCMILSEKSDEFCEGVMFAMEEVDKLPTADVVEVPCKCEECKHEIHNGGDCDRVLIHTRRNLVLEQNEYLYFKLNYCEYGEPINYGPSKTERK